MADPDRIGRDRRRALSVLRGGSEPGAPSTSANGVRLSMSVRHRPGDHRVSAGVQALHRVRDGHHPGLGRRGGPDPRRDRGRAGITGADRTRGIGPRGVVDLRALPAHRAVPGPVGEADRRSMCPPGSWPASAVARPAGSNAVSCRTLQALLGRRAGAARRRNPRPRRRRAGLRARRLHRVPHRDARRGPLGRDDRRRRRAARVHRDAGARWLRRLRPPHRPCMPGVPPTCCATCVRSPTPTPTGQLWAAAMATTLTRGQPQRPQPPANAATDRLDRRPAARRSATTTSARWPEATPTTTARHSPLADRARTLIDRFRRLRRHDPAVRHRPVGAVHEQRSRTRHAGRSRSNNGPPAAAGAPCKASSTSPSSAPTSTPPPNGDSTNSTSSTSYSPPAPGYHQHSHQLNSYRRTIGEGQGRAASMPGPSIARIHRSSP